MRDLLTAVTKILSSAYCILIVAIYVVIVINKFTHLTPENHHDVEVGREREERADQLTQILSAVVPSLHLPDVGVLPVPVIPAVVPHKASQGTSEQKVARQRISQTRSSHLWCWLSSVLHL